MRRFYAPPDKFHSEGITLGTDESHHIRKVLRLSFGDQVRIFDGTGNEFRCEITGTVKRHTSLKIIKQIPPLMPESNLALKLAVSLLKADKFDLVIQKAVELGITEFIPLKTKRSDVKLSNPDKKIERWQKIVIGATKQTGRATLMKIGHSKDFRDFIRAPRNDEVLALFAERNGQTFADLQASPKITAVIGPEGGWEDTELDIAKKKGARIITLGGRILRAETAAITIPAILQHRFGDLH